MPMFFGGMVCGPLGGLIIKYVDKLLQKHIPSGFEMLINNFSAGILAAALAIIGYFGLSYIFVGITIVLGMGVEGLNKYKCLPITSLLVEPAKVLFLNNAINHGVFTPLGMIEASEHGRSILFMVESNPGPGLGILLSYMIFGKGSTKKNAYGASIIHFFGGIHELYFPFVLLNPILIVPLILGGATGVGLEQLIGGGLIAPASPGSIITELLMTPYNQG
jgi:PTS system mannitol-specific IIC component